MSGILAAFATEQALRQALSGLRNHAFTYETYTPKPLDDDPSGSPLPLIMFIAGMAVFLGFFYLLTWAFVWDWPIDIGGRPLFSWPAFIPIVFELGILAAVAAGLLGYFVVNRLPHLYDPIDHCDSMQRAMRDLWVVAVETDDQAHADRAGEILQGYSPLRVEGIPAE